MGLFPRQSSDAALFAVCHQIPGRMRLRLPILREDPRLDGRVVVALRGLDGVYAVRSNLACASLIIHHRGPSAPAHETLLNVLRPIINASAPPTMPQSKPTRAVPRPNPARFSIEPARQRPADCSICRLRLSATRWLLADVWRCWRDQWTLSLRARLIASLALFRP